MAHNVNFKLYLKDESASKTLTESHPKLTATNDDFEAVGEALEGAYGIPLDEVTVQSETTVFTAA